MDKYCSNCGQELRDNQEVCLGCGKILSKNMKIYNQDNGHKTYKVATGITMIILGALLLCVSGTPYYDKPVLVFAIPGLCGLIAGILNINSKKNQNLLMPAAISLFLGSISNFIGIKNISLYTIVAIIFGIFNIIYDRETK